MNKPVRFGRHARRRMKWRKISEEETYLVIENPDKMEESIKGRVNAYKSLGQRYKGNPIKNFPRKSS